MKTDKIAKTEIEFINAIDEMQKEIENHGYADVTIYDGSLNVSADLTSIRCDTEGWDQNENFDASIKNDLINHIWFTLKNIETIRAYENCCSEDQHSFTIFLKGWNK